MDAVTISEALETAANAANSAANATNHSHHKHRSLHVPAADNHHDPPATSDDIELPVQEAEDTKCD